MISGNNDYTNTNGGKFPATAHFDMATGWGSPNAATLRTALQPPAGGCPAVTGLSLTHGATSGGAHVVIRRIRPVRRTAVRFGSAVAPFHPTSSRVSSTPPPRRRR